MRAFTEGSAMNQISGLVGGDGFDPVAVAAVRDETDAEDDGSDGKGKRKAKGKVAKAKAKAAARAEGDEGLKDGAKAAEVLEADTNAMKTAVLMKQLAK
eukprot:8220087-Alexandrium_andersonii.AAC.1